ncbi:hypothetical protein GCM10023322_62740 [Rugosimonospora acidiphila]|uniref:Uncharacterized protein n=1 Tax=Rugosimonospora acidiphila TaxID=556531 RepID=A0ABP9SJ83_9ACTN
MIRGRGRDVLFGLPVVLAVLACVAVAYGVLLDSAGARLAAPVWWGAGAMLAVGAGIGVWRHLPGRAARSLGRVSGSGPAAG